MYKFNELTTKEEITDWALYMVQQCLFYSTKNKYMIERIKQIEKDYTSLDEYKNNIKKFINFYNIEYISQTNIKNYKNLDINKKLFDYESQINIKNYKNLDINKKLFDYESQIKNNLITLDDFYNMVNNLMERYELLK